MAARIVLTALTGVLRGQQFVLEGEGLEVVGRAADCRVRLPLNDRTASRHHCLFEIDGGSLRVRDLGSLNGTYINGMRIAPGNEGKGPDGTVIVEPSLPLLEGDEVRVGMTVLRVDSEVLEEIGVPDEGPLLASC